MHYGNVQINYPTCLTLIGADNFLLIAAKPTAVYDDRPGHVTSFIRTCDSRVILLHHCLTLEQAR